MQRRAFVSFQGNTASSVISFGKDGAAEPTLRSTSQYFLATVWAAAPDFVDAFSS